LLKMHTWWTKSRKWKPAASKPAKTGDVPERALWAP